MSENTELTVRPIWVCGVVRSGYHNGAGCRPGEPHRGWGCGYRYEISIPATLETAALLQAAGITVTGLPPVRPDPGHGYAVTPG